MKQRVVGIIVIGCLAVIFIPWLLDGEGVAPPTMTSNIPPPPPLPEMPLIEPQRPQIHIDDIADEAAGPAASGEDVQDQPRLNEQGLPEAWTVRLGIFEELANVEALVNHLRTSGYKGYSRPLDDGDDGERGLIGVYVGPLLTPSEAEEMRQELMAALDLEGVVEQFRIAELQE